MCRDGRDAIDALKRRDPKKVIAGRHDGHDRTVVFMFPGGGAQYVNMGRDLYEEESTYRREVDECLELLERDVSVGLRRVLFPTGDFVPEATKRIQQPSTALPLLFTVEYATAKLLMSWGVQPTAMIGHSMGEYAAACLADVLTLEDALRLVTHRGQLFDTLPAGAMLSVALAEETVRALLTEDVSIAATNGPALCVVSGSAAGIQAMETVLTDREVDHRRVPISVAAHSSHVDPVLEAFDQFMRGIRLREPRIPYVSNVTGTWMTATDATDPAYWVKHLRRTVRFGDGLTALSRDEDRVLVETGPGQTLGTFARHHPDASASAIVSTLRHPRERTSDVAFLLEGVGRLWLSGGNVDWTAFYAPERRQRVALPTYPLQRRRHWVEARKAAIESGVMSMSSHEPPSEHGAVDRDLEAEGAPATESATQSASPSRRRARIVQMVKETLHELSGREIAEFDDHSTFLRLGFDSLLLTRASVALKKKFDVTVTFRQLFEEAPTIDALAEHIDTRLPRDMLVEEPASTVEASRGERSHDVSAPVTPVESGHGKRPSPSRLAAGEPARADDGLERIFAMQLQVMSEQLQALRAANGRHPEVAPGDDARHVPQTDVPGPVVDTGEPVADRSPDATLAGPSARAGVEATGFGPFRPVKKISGQPLSLSQQRHLDDFIARYTRRTKQSKRFAQAHRRRLADARVVSGFRNVWKELVYPIVTNRSSGARVWDLDGNEYVDITMGFGSNLLGHSPRFVTEAVERQLKQGVELGGNSALSGKVAELICELTGMERATFCQTGSEAVLGALRVARTVTGCDKIAMFAGSYHGRTDCTVVRPVTLNGRRRSVPHVPGIPQRMVEDTLLLDYGAPRNPLMRYGRLRASWQPSWWSRCRVATPDCSRGNSSMR